jgi:hypothetical protein
VFWSALAFAQEPASPAVSTSFNDAFTLRYWKVDARLPPPNADVPVLNYVEQVDRLNATATAGKWTFGLQVDEVSLWADRYYFDDVLTLERDLTADGLPNVFPGDLGDTAYVNPAKIRATVEDDWGTVTLGDSYTAFGRGLALNLNRNVDIDIDTSIQGAKAVLRPGAWDLTFVAGQANRQQVYQDNPNVEIAGDYRHLITGFRAERFGLGPANLGAHVVGYDFVEDPGLGASLRDLHPFDAVVGGGTVELSGVGGVDTYLEGDVFSYGKDVPAPFGEDAGNLGYGLYASANAYPGRFVVQVEGKRYYQVERLNSFTAPGPELYEVAAGPTLEYERVINEDTSTTLNSNDVWGARGQVTWAAVPGKLTPYVSAAVFRDLDLVDGHFNAVPETIVHPLAGVEWIQQGVALIANAGYRVDDRDGTDYGQDRLIHGDATLNFPIAGPLVAYLAAAGSHFHWGTNTFQQADFVEATSSWGLTWNTWLTGTFFLDKSTNPIALAQATGNIDRTTFAGAEIQVKPGTAWTLKAFYGAQEAGIRCSGGQCRQLPGFDGARFSVVGTF